MVLRFLDRAGSAEVVAGADPVAGRDEQPAVEDQRRGGVDRRPGLAESEKNSIRQMTRWEVMVGPESGFLLPLFIVKNREDLFS